jgi:hypothetical protein
MRPDGTSIGSSYSQRPPKNTDTICTARNGGCCSGGSSLGGSFGGSRSGGFGEGGSFLGD